MFNENKIVAQIINGDAAAFARLVKQYHALVFHTVYRITGNREDTEDICQEVFISVFRNLSTFAFQCKLSSWIIRIAHNASISHLRKYKKDGRNDWYKDDAQEYATGETPQDTVDRKQLSGHIHRMIKQMPHPYKTVLTMYHLNECSYLEIASATGMPGGTVKGNLFRARKLLREKLELHLGKELA